MVCLVVVDGGVTQYQCSLLVFSRCKFADVLLLESSFEARDYNLYHSDAQIMIYLCNEFLNFRSKYNKESVERRYVESQIQFYTPLLTSPWSLYSSVVIYL
jgi:hypothetical protein